MSEGARPPRVAFAGRGIGQLTYYESILAALIDRGAEVELLLDEELTQDRSQSHTALAEFRALRPSLKTDWAVRRSDAHRERIFALREMRTYRSYLVRERTTPHYVMRGRKYLARPDRKQLKDPDFIPRLMLPETEQRLCDEEARTPPDPGILDLLRRKAPDVLLACPANMRFSEETDYVKAAKALGIPTGICVMSWDNLSTKGLIQILPDQLYVWNDDQRRDALEIHHADPAHVVVAGAPFFDKWFDPAKAIPDRADFCARAGLDATRPILLYLGSSAKIAPDETWFLDALVEAIRSSDDPTVRAHQLLVRPHPANAAPYADFTRPGVSVWPKDGAMPETQANFEDLRASFACASAAIGINTSGMIDAVLAGRPTFTVTLPQYVETQADAVHFRYLADGGALYLSDSIDAFLGAFSSLLGGSDPKAEARGRFVRSFARPRGLDRAAGDVIAEAALALAGR